MKTGKTILAMVLAFALICSIGIVPAFADDDSVNQSGEQSETFERQVAIVEENDEVIAEVRGTNVDTLVTIKEGQESYDGVLVTYSNEEGTPTFTSNENLDSTPNNNTALKDNNTDIKHDVIINADVIGETGIQTGNANVDITVNGAIEATTTGVDVSLNDADKTTEIKAESITAGKDAIDINCTSGTVIISVEGDVEAGMSGINLKSDVIPEETSSVKVEIDETLNVTGEIGAPILLGPNDTGENVEITVWEITVNGEKAKEGKIVKDATSDGTPAGEQQSENAANLEQRINYIIKIDATQTNNLIYDKDTAHAKETVTVTVKVPDGHKLKTVYTDTNRSIKAVDNGDGTVSLTVPAGGGVLLYADFEKLPSPKPEPENNGGSGGTGGWTAKQAQVVVIFDPDGGKWSNGKTAPIIKYGGSATWFVIPEAPTREGFRFVKWQCDDPEITKGEPGQSFCPYKAGTFTFTPVWEKE